MGNPEQPDENITEPEPDTEGHTAVPDEDDDTEGHRGPVYF